MVVVFMIVAALLGYAGIADAGNGKTTQGGTEILVALGLGLVAWILEIIETRVKAKNKAITAEAKRNEREYELRSRELDMKERELELREDQLNAENQD